MNSYGLRAQQAWQRMNPGTDLTLGPDFEAIGIGIERDIETGMERYRQSPECPSDPQARQGWLNMARLMVEEAVIDGYFRLLDPESGATPT